MTLLLKMNMYNNRWNDKKRLLLILMTFLTCASPHIQAVERLLTRKRSFWPVCLYCKMHPTFILYVNACFHLVNLRIWKIEMSLPSSHDILMIFRVTGVTVETFSEMLVAVEIDLQNKFNLPPRNVLMILLIWLRTYPAYPLLSLVFDMSLTSSSTVVRRNVNVLRRKYAPEIVWPSLNEWRSFTGRQYF